MPKNILFLSIIIIFSFVTRVYQIDNFPPSLNWDEVSLGYNAYSLLMTGKDEWGVAFPTIFWAFGDYKLPGYVYFSVIFPYHVRLTSVIFGTILVFTSYYITKKLTGHLSLVTGISAALLVAVSPWSWFLSRIALEANVATSIFSVGMSLYFSKMSPIITTLFLTMPVWIYNSYRVFIPLMLIPLWILNRKKISILTALILLIPMFGQTMFTSGQARFKWVSIVDNAAIGKIEYLRNSSKSKLKNLFYNRVTYFGFNFTRNYLNHFNPIFLFTSGNTNFQFNIPNQGLIFLILAPFFYWGIYDIFKTKNYLLITWLILAPIASSLTKDSPHVLRSITFLPLPYILISRQLTKITNKYILLMIIFIFVGQWALYCLSFNNYSRDYSWSWQYGTKQLSDYLVKHQSEYDQILITKKSGEPHIFLLYYQKYSPQEYLTIQNLNRYFQSDWYWVDSFANYRFINDWEFEPTIATLDPDKKYLLVSSFPIAATKLTEIKYLDSVTAYYLYEK